MKFIIRRNSVHLKSHAISGRFVVLVSGDFIIGPLQNLHFSAAQRIQDGAKIVTDSASMIKNNIDLDKLNLLKADERKVNEGKDEI